MTELLLLSEPSASHASTATAANSIMNTPASARRMVRFHPGLPPSPVVAGPARDLMCCSCSPLHVLFSFIAALNRRNGSTGSAPDPEAVTFGGQVVWRDTGRYSILPRPSDPAPASARLRSGFGDMANDPACPWALAAGAPSRAVIRKHARQRTQRLLLLARRNAAKAARQLQKPALLRRRLERLFRPQTLKEVADFDAKYLRDNV